jgi:beta-lactamase superfamily II metal-dependent hydrolase
MVDLTTPLKNILKRPTLEKLPIKGKLDLVVLSHIDNDHIIGLLDLLEEIKDQRDTAKKELVMISKLWHNSFNDLLHIHEDPITFLKNSILAIHSGNAEKWKNGKLDHINHHERVSASCGSCLSC